MSVLIFSIKTVRYNSSTGSFLNDGFGGRCGANGSALHKWPSRYPNITVSNFFLRDNVKDNTYVSPLSRDVQELKTRIALQ